MDERIDKIGVKVYKASRPHEVGQVVEVYHSVHNTYLKVLFPDGRKTGYVHLNHWRKATKQEESEVMKENQWTFNVSSLVGVSWDTISNTLSYKNPVAFLDVEGVNGEDEHHVMIHNSIMEDKGPCCEGGMDLIDHIKELVDNQHYYDQGMSGTLESPRLKKRIIRLVREIKMAPYLNVYQQKAKVTVTLPKITC